jgi:PIN domain nuclease of toxin-antitoxin system
VKILLDTHVWLWMIAEPEKLSKHARRHINRDAEELMLSAASSWEISIKWALGKLPLPSAPSEFFSEHMAATKTYPLAIEHSHALRVATLPRHHHDPFDRLLIAQAQVERIPILTADPNFKPYDVELIPA